MSLNQLQSFKYTNGMVLFVIFIGIVLTRLIHIDHNPIFDEFYHILAAKGWLMSGNFTILEGVYVRASVFTLIVAQFFSAFGESIVVARLPAVIAGSAWVLLVFVWLSKHTDRVTAWVAVLLLLLAPWVLYASQIVRFYSLHGLLFFMLSISAYSVVHHIYDKTRPPTQYRILLSFALIVFLVLLSAHLQPVTYIGLLAILIWACFYHLTKLANNKTRFIHFGSLVLLALLVFAAMWFSGALFVAWDVLRNTPYWGEGNTDNYKFYYYLYSSEYKYLVFLFPVAIVFAFKKHAGISVFSATLFLVGMLLHSIAGAKADRYVIYLIPFFFIIWSLAISWLYNYVTEYLSSRLKGRTWMQFLGQQQTASIRIVVIISLLGFLFMNAALQGVLLTMTKDKDELWTDSIYGGEGDWASVANRLNKEIEGDVVVLSESSVKSIYYLDRYDIALNAVEVTETDTKQEFGIDFRFGTPAISTVESVQIVMQKYPRGLIVAEKRRWLNSPYIVPTATRTYVENNTVNIPLPEDSHLIAYKWNSSTSAN